MNLEQLRKNIGHRIQMVPPAHHLDASGHTLPTQDEDWLIEAINDENIRLSKASGHFVLLGKDHVHHFTTNPQRSSGQVKFGFLTLHVQVIVQGGDVRVVPNNRPGEPVTPLATSQSRALAAREYFTPEFARIAARQVHVLDRAIANFVTASAGRHPMLGDTWDSLRPSQPLLFPNAPEFRDLPPPDATPLIEFYDALRGIADMLEGWIAQRVPGDVNAWNVLMQKVQLNLRLAVRAAARFCPDRQYDPTMPAGGTLIDRAQRSIANADRSLRAHLARHGVH